MTRIGAAALALALSMAIAITPTAPLALSCPTPSPQNAFMAAQQAGGVYLILRGSLAFDAADFAAAADQTRTAGVPADVPARLTGHALGREGFLRPYTADVVLRPVCFGPWCGQIGPGTDYVVFARVTDARPVIEVGPCDRWVFPASWPDIEATLAACLARGGCAP